MKQVEIPYGCYWSTPFARWQGAFQHLNSVEFAAWQCRREIDRLSVDPASIDHGILGTTVIQHHSFYGLPWLTGLAGLGHVTGVTLSQACATGVRAILAGAQEVATGLATTSLVITADRCSNGPHIYYPEPSGPGGTGTHEDWVMDNFSCDPLGRHSMVQTAENVALRRSITREQQHEVVLLRQAQYQAALADDREFQKRYMSLPFEVPARSLEKIQTTIDGDEGIFTSTSEGLAKLRPVVKGGTVTFGGQTYPADGNAGIVVTSPDRVASLSKDNSIRIELLGFGQARAKLAYMPEAPIPAAQKALTQAGVEIKDLAAVKTHNPFAVNDILFSSQTGFPIEKMNNYGCSLIWGHPQGPTGMRSIIELIEELVRLGGGLGLFTGCAAGDSAMALVVKVSQK